MNTSIQTIRIIVRKELHDARGNKWIYLYSIIVAILGIVIAQTGISSGGAVTLQLYGRTVATLVNLCLFLSPLVAMTLGTAAISGERDQGTLEQLLSQPITRNELLLGKYCGLWIALFVATVIGFAPAGIIIGMYASFIHSINILIYPLLSQLLISVMLAIGLVISVTARSRAQATAVGIAIWFLFVLAYDMLLLGSLSVISLPTQLLSMLLFLNPVDASRILTVLFLEPDLYILGPAGAYLVDTFGVTATAFMLFGSLLVWTVVPLVAAMRFFGLTRKKYFRVFRLKYALNAALTALLIVILAGCSSSKKEGEEPEEQAKEEVKPAEPEYKADKSMLEKGKELYASTCAPCHGAKGHGDGPAAANLNPKPRDHSNGEYMNKLTDQHIGNVIKKGGGIVGFPSMPAQPQLKTEEINGIIAFLRTLPEINKK
jgi:ABC-type transport system involved in multi-copper enzyme maturation permease subunit/mono/diheme cytochrome c family protein